MSVNMLLIEDDDNAATLFSVACKGHPEIALARASTQHAAVDLLKAGDFALVVLDLRLPNGEGFALYKAIAEAAGESFIVVLTGQSIPKVENEIAMLGSPVLHKSHDMAGTLNAILHCWQRYGGAHVMHVWAEELEQVSQDMGAAVQQEHAVGVQVRAMVETANRLQTVISLCGGRRDGDGH